MKDPAFLFYSKDFFTGVIDLTMEERGQYITLLCVQHQKGHLSDRAIKIAVGEVSEFVLSKFAIDENGLYYNERLDNEIHKRQRHSEKQRENINKRWGKDTKAIPSALPNEYQDDTKNIPLVNVNVNTNVNEDVSENGNEIVFAKLVREVIEHLNMLAGTCYRPSGQATRRLIQARTNDGFTLNDFKTVIDKKVTEWKGTDYEKFLRPETLFGSKFEGYLNQPIKTKAQKSGNPFLDRAKEKGTIGYDV